MRVAVVIVATAALLGTYGCSAARPPAPESCPPTWGGKNAGGWVPRAADLDGMRRTLVPGDPAEALICAATTNGAATSHSYIGPSLTAAYRSGDWRLVRPADPCMGRTTGAGRRSGWCPTGRCPSWCARCPATAAGPPAPNTARARPPPWPRR
ncbi:MAG: hypothetical protein HOY71_26060 [Nonomuraea sp.]|nr:hypothetical protein [Nonomuraea sp.]